MFQSKYVRKIGPKISTSMNGGVIPTHMAQDLRLYLEMKPVRHYRELCLEYSRLFNLYHGITSRPTP